MIRHHPSDALLVGNAAGTLPPLHARVLDFHLAQCPVCRDTLRLGEDLGGALLDAERPVALAEGALARVTARLDAVTPDVRPARPSTRTLPGIDALARGRRWRPAGLGIQFMPLAPRDRTGTRLDLIRVAAGVALPRHDHSGPELTCVLAGGYTDQTGEYHAGDIAEGDIGFDHQPRALAGKPCVCLIATTGALRTHSFWARLLQPILGL